LRESDGKFLEQGRGRRQNPTIFLKNPTFGPGIWYIELAGTVIPAKALMGK
jgi:hypothetical protein